MLKSRNKYLLFIVAASALLTSCKNPDTFSDKFSNTNDRVWIGKEYWSIPIEDWKVENHRIVTTGNKANMRLFLLQQEINGDGTLKIKLNLGLYKKAEKPGHAGVELGLYDHTDKSYKSLAYFGKGIKIGVDPEGYFSIDDIIQELPEGFDLSSMELSINLTNSLSGSRIVASLSDHRNRQISLLGEYAKRVEGGIAIFNDIEKNNSGQSPNYWFDNLHLQGKLISTNKENCYGPVLWTMYTLSKGSLKLTAQMPPLGESDSKTVYLEIRRKGNTWERIQSAEINKLSYTATFKLENWDNRKDTHYRVAYRSAPSNGKPELSYYDGLIRKEPAGKELVMGALTCQYHYGFPYSPLAENLERHNPDILYFSGDQLYEQNGGYGIERFPADRAILNYLGKWYMFGWAFGDMLRDRPSICIPDDHEVFQGNLWGDNGKHVDMQSWSKSTDCLSGFVEPADMIKVVMITNCSHLPDPYDPEPMEQDIPVYYTQLNYGGVSFAIVGDRVFKSGPELVSTWEGRKDHLTDPDYNTAQLEHPDLKLLGDRQLKFLEEWSLQDTSILRVVLSQTLLTNSATHHGGGKMLLIGDLDSGGWPKTGRDKALNIFRKAKAFHICGDQHLPFMVQYGIDSYRDAGWAFCTPAITVGYQRRFLPDTLGWPVLNRPEHGLHNTGYYSDAFGNKNYIYAVGNPEDITADKNRYIKAQKSSSGFGIIRFNITDTLIRSEAYRFMAKFGENDDDDIFPGWPLTINPYTNNIVRPSDTQTKPNQDK